MLHLTLHAWRALAIVTSLLLVTIVLFPATASAAKPTCFGLKATIVGTNHADKLIGTDKKDVIVGLGGADKIKGGDKRDYICAGKGADTVKGGDGNDLIFGEGGGDRLYGGGGDFNQIAPGGGDDFANAGDTTSGDEVIYLDSPNGVVGDLGAGTVSGFGDDEVV